jgi:hypothetical protein
MLERVRISFTILSLWTWLCGQHRAQEVFGLEREVNTYPLGDGMPDLADNYYMTYNDSPVQQYFNLSAAHVFMGQATPEPIERCFSMRDSATTTVLVCLTPQKAGGVYTAHVYTNLFSGTPNNYYVRYSYSKTFTLVAGMQFYPFVSSSMGQFFMISTLYDGTKTTVNFVQIVISTSTLTLNYRVTDNSVSVTGEFLVGNFTRFDFSSTAASPTMLLINSHRTTVPYTSGNVNRNFLIILPTATTKARLASPTFSGGSQPDFLFDFEFYDNGIFHMTFCYNLDPATGLCEPNYAQVIVDYANWFFGLNIFTVKSGPFMIQNTGGVNAKLPASCTFWTARMLRLASGADPGDPVFGIFFVKTDTTGTTITFKPFKTILVMPYVSTQADLDKPYSTYGFSSPVKASDFDFFIKKFSSGTYWNSIRVTDSAGNLRYFGNINSYRNHASDYVMIFWSPTFECESAEHVWANANNVAVQPQSTIIARPNMNFFCLRKNVVLSVTNSLPAHTIFTHPSTTTNLSLSESFKSVPTKNTTALATISGSSQSRTVKQTTWRNIYEVIEGLPANGALGVDVMLASFIDVPINSVFGWNISYQLITPEMPNVIFTNRVFSPLTFIRNDPPDVAATVDADEIIYTSMGGVLKDQNRRLGFISCKETVDSFVNKTTRVCQTITAMNTGTGRIYKVYEDYASGNIYVAAQSLADNLPYLFVLTLSSGTVDRLNVSLGNAQTRRSLDICLYYDTIELNPLFVNRDHSHIQRAWSDILGQGF